MDWRFLANRLKSEIPSRPDLFDKQSLIWFMLSDKGLSSRTLGSSTVLGSRGNQADIEAAAIEGAVQRLRPKLMTVCAVLASLIPILFESGIGSDVISRLRRQLWGGMISLDQPFMR